MKKRDFFEEFATRLNIEESLVRSTKELNAVIQHIVQLLTDSYILYSNNSFPSSVFLSITALEEVSKGHWGIFMSGVQPKSKPRNIFRDHKTKHKLAATHTVPMGKRLKESIGEEELYKMMELAHSSDMVKLRESSLYFQRENETLVTPSAKIDKKLARTLLLFSIEVFDDALVGTTSYSMEIDKETDAIFEKLTNDIDKE